jgi:hypothetical protein
MTKFLVFLFALAVNFSFSQASTGNGVNNFSNASQMMTSGNGLWFNSSSSSTKVKGSPYLFESWNSDDALIFMQDKAYQMRSLNYNIQLDRFEAKVAEDSVFAFNPKDIKKITIDNRTFKRYLDGKLQRNSFFEELVATKSLVILRQFNVEIIPGNFNPMTQQKMSDDQMVQRETYYYTTDNETLVEMKLNKYSILKLIDADKKDILNDYAKENHLNFKDIYDLKKILQYYNTI